MKSTRLRSKAASSTVDDTDNTVDTDNTGGQIPGVPREPPCSDPESRGRMSREGLYAGVPRPRQVSLGRERPQGRGPGRSGAWPSRGLCPRLGVWSRTKLFRGRGRSGVWPRPGAGPRPGPFQREDQVRGGAQAIPGAGPGRPRHRTWR